MEITEELIRQLVIEVVDRIEAMRSAPIKPLLHLQRAGEHFQSKVLTGEDIEYMFRRKTESVVVTKRTIITPLARERSKDLGVRIEIV